MNVTAITKVSPMIKLNYLKKKKRFRPILLMAIEISLNLDETMKKKVKFAYDQIVNDKGMGKY
ncbi:hypothetical protein CR513_46867, partial [Mucuna pruriens]